jgi:hypothetical protein
MTSRLTSSRAAAQSSFFTRRHEDHEGHEEGRDTLVFLVIFASSCELNLTAATAALTN